jgi:hypothetical protein
VGEVGLRGGELGEDIIRRRLQASWGSKARGERAVNGGVSRREDTRADMEDPLLRRVEAAGRRGWFGSIVDDVRRAHGDVWELVGRPTENGQSFCG